MDPSSSSTSSPAILPPIPTREKEALIDGVPTRVVAQAFDDRVLVVVTQVGKVGQLIQASLPEALQLPPMPSTPPTPPLPALPPPHPSTSLLALFGTPPTPALQPIADLYAGQVAACVWFDAALDGAPRRPVVVGLALKRLAPRAEAGEDDEVDWARERQRFGQVMALVMECRVW